MGTCIKYNCDTKGRMCYRNCGHSPIGCEHYSSNSKPILIPELYWNLLPIKDSMPKILRSEKYGNLYYDGSRLFFCSEGSNYFVKQLNWQKIKVLLDNFSYNPCKSNANLVTDFLLGMLKTYTHCSECGKKFRIPRHSTMCSKCKETSKHIKMYDMGYKPWETRIDIRFTLGMDVDYDRHMTLEQYNIMLEQFNRGRHEDVFIKDGRQIDRGHGQTSCPEEEIPWGEDEQERSYP